MKNSLLRSRKVSITTTIVIQVCKTKAYSIAKKERMGSPKFFWIRIHFQKMEQPPCVDSPSLKMVHCWPIKLPRVVRIAQRLSLFEHLINRWLKTRFET